METTQKQQAHDLRKSGRFDEALPIYRELWAESKDRFDGAGLLHCLRKLGMFHEAVPLGEDLIQQYPDFKWVRQEVKWTLISGVLLQLKDEEPLERVLNVGKKIMALDPDPIALKLTVMRVLKIAKKNKKWEVMNDWAIKIDPNSLPTEALKDERGHEGWSNQSVWYNYRIRALIETGHAEEGIKLADQIKDRFPKQRKYFVRLQALGYSSMAERDQAKAPQYRAEAEKLLRPLCARPNSDSWLLHGYGKVLKALGRNNEAMSLFAQAAKKNLKLEMNLPLYFDFGLILHHQKKPQEARAHFLLCQFIREKNGWPIPEDLARAITELNKELDNIIPPHSLDMALNLCRKEWDHRISPNGGRVRQRRPRSPLRE